MTGDVDLPVRLGARIPHRACEAGCKGGPAMSTVDVDIQKLKIRP